MKDETLGRVAYAAYIGGVGGKTWDGKDCPTWDGLTPKIRDAWCAAADAAVDERLQPLKPGVSA